MFRREKKPSKEAKRTSYVAEKTGQTNFQNELAAEMTRPDPIAVELELLLAMH
jgi:hypothetical protein